MKIIWISPDGSDITGNGSRENPYQTIDYGITLFSDGDQIRLLPGTYNPRDSLIFNNLTGSIFSEEPGKAIIQPLQTNTSPAVIYVANSDRFHVIGVECNQALDPTTNYAGISINNSINCWIYSCTVEDFESNATNCFGIHSNCVTGSGRIENCTIHNINCCGDNVYGIFSGGLDIIDCTVSSISGAGNCNSYGIYGGSIYINAHPEPPIFDPIAGTYTIVLSVTITSPTAGADIYYTTDGSTPTPGSTLYTGPITVDATTTVKAIAYLNGQSSAVSTALYTIAPEEWFVGFNENVPAPYAAYTYYNNPNWSFTRNSSAYQTDSVTYTMTIVGSNIPRIDATTRALLIEPLSYNLLNYSENMNSWTKLRLTSVQTDATMAPNDTTTMDGIVANVLDHKHNVKQVFDATSYFVVSVNTENYATYSVYAKAGNKNFIKLSGESSYAATGDSNEGLGAACFYDLQNGIIGNSSGGAYAYRSTSGWYFIEAAKNNCWRCILPGYFIRNWNGHGNYIMPRLSGAEGSNDAVYSGDTVSINSYFWGAQFEPHGYATSYIPTTGTTDEYRNQDIPKFTNITPPMPTGLGGSNMYKKLKITFDMKCLYGLHRISGTDYLTLSDFDDLYYFDISPGNNTNRIYFKGNSQHPVQGQPAPVENGRLQFGVYDSTGTHRYLISDGPLLPATHHSLNTWRSFEIYFDFEDLSNTYGLIDGVSDCFGRFAPPITKLAEKINLSGSCSVNLSSNALYIGCNHSGTNQAGAQIKNMVISWEI